MLQEEIARLTGKLVFQVDNRPLATFEKKLGGVLVMLRELSTLANKKFTVKVALDSKSLRSQIERATNTKISLKNVDVSEEALRMQGKRIQDYLDKTTINLRNVKFDVGQLVGQKRFIKTMMGQMSMELPIKVKMAQLEADLRRDLKGISERNPLKIKVDLNNNNLAMKLRRAMIEAQRRMGELKIRVADPQVRLKVDKQHLVEEIRQAIANHQFDIRIGARGGFGGSGAGRRERESGLFSGRQGDRGLSAAMGFARGAIPGLGAAFAVSKINDINQKVTAATNSLEAVSGSEENFKSNKNYLENMTKEMGLNFRDVAPQFSSIYQSASPSIGVKGTQDMFRGIMQYGTVHGLDKEAMKGSMVALSQMFGKDKIQSEEARQQFAERMPNGMALLAQAAGNAKQTKNGTVSELNDLMQSGKADPKKILPELGRLMKELSEKNDAYKKSLETTRVAQGRMNREFEVAVTIFSNAGFDKGMATFFNTTAEALERAKPLLEGLGKAFEILMTPVTAFIHLWGIIAENWGKFADKLGVSKTALTTFAAAVGIFLLPFGEIAIAVGAAIVALDDFATYLNGGDSMFGDWIKNTEGAQAAIDKLKASWETFTNLFKTGDLTKSADEFGNSIKGISFSDMFISTLHEISRILDLFTATVNRLTNAGMFAQQANGSGTALEGNFRNVQGLVMGKDWTDNFMQNKILNDMASTPNMTDNSIPDRQSLTSDQIPAAVAAAINAVAAQRDAEKAMTVEVTVPIQIDGIIQAGDLAKMVQEPLKQAAADAWRQALGTARAQQAERQ